MLPAFPQIAYAQQFHVVCGENVALFLSEGTVVPQNLVSRPSRGRRNELPKLFKCSGHS